MCLAVPCQVMELRAEGRALVDVSGVRKEISVALVEDVQVGDYLVLHVGFALAKMDPEEAKETLRLVAEIAQ